MTQRIIRSILFLFAIALFATIALGQSPFSPEAPTTPSINQWQVAQAAGSSKHKIVVVTLDQPQRRQTCRVKSFTMDKLVCSHIGGPHTYLPQQVLALILPGDAGLRLPIMLGLNAGLGVSIWGTVVLVATCPACAAATALAAFICFGFAGAVAMTDDQPDRLFYLADGQRLTGKMSILESR